MKSDLPFGFERPQDSPGFLLWQTTVVWQRQIREALKAYDVSHPQFVIMAILLWFEANNYETNQVLLVEWTKLDKMTVSNSLSKLVSKGLVKRVESGKDTRAKLVSITSKGRDLVSRLVTIVEGIDDKFFGKLEATHQKNLLSILHTLVAAW